MLATFASLFLLAAQGAGAVAAPQAEAPAVMPTLSIEQQTGLRCGVAFGIVAQLQKGNQPEGAKYPPIAERGREFFVRTTAQLMEDTGADRQVIGELVLKTVDGFVADEASLPAIMPACLSLLDASGL